MAEVKETAHIFGRNKNLVGIISEPRTSARSGPAIVLLNAGIIHRVGPSRVGVEIARALASEGYRVLRFDLSGIGDSAGSPDLASLADIVRGDITEAIDLMEAGAPGNGVVLFGICSGADNAFYVGTEDARVVGLVLIDPEVHPTPKFKFRDTLRKVTNGRSWMNVVSGRFFMRRVKRRLSRDMARPPGFYGLLTLDQQRATEGARLMAGRGVQFLYVITGEHPFCNYPGQISDSLGGAIPPAQMVVEWRMEADHLLRREVDRSWLAAAIQRWLGRLRPAGLDRGAA